MGKHIAGPNDRVDGRIALDRKSQEQAGRNHALRCRPRYSTNSYSTKEHMVRDLDTELETITFWWSRNYGDCIDCDLPAAYQAVDAYGPGKHQPLCSICAAEAAANGQPIQRLDSE